MSAELARTSEQQTILIFWTYNADGCLIAAFRETVKSHVDEFGLCVESRIERPDQVDQVKQTLMKLTSPST